MRVILPGKPFHRHGFSTLGVASTTERVEKGQSIDAAGLFLLAAAATATIFIHDPLVGWGYALGIFLLSGYAVIRDVLIPRAFRLTIPGFALVLISLWGFLQLAAGTTVYRYGTWDASLRTAALGATAFVASRTLTNARLRLRFLWAFAWFGCAVSMISVVAYFTSPGRVLWIFPSPYPDVWGVFLSRNDFAGFLELSFPVALWLGLKRVPRAGGPHAERLRMPLWAPASMLAAGLASSSRAGAALLIVEAAVILVMIPGRRAALRFGALAVALIAIAGAGTLAGRLADPDPLRYRREIAESTMNMIAEHPWRGFGLGTFSQVYPAYAKFDAGAVVEHTHDDWLEWAAEGGIPLALVWVVLAMGICVPAFRSVWGLGILAALLHALVDYPFARFGLTAWNFALIGALSRAEVREVSQSGHYLSGTRR